MSQHRENLKAEVSKFAAETERIRGEFQVYVQKVEQELLGRTQKENGLHQDIENHLAQLRAEGVAVVADSVPTDIDHGKAAAAAQATQATPILPLDDPAPAEFDSNVSRRT